MRWRLFFTFGIMEMNDDYFMRQALREAQKAFDADEVPVGAVVVMQDKIIGRGHNQVEQLTDSTAHAEIIALTAAFNYLGSKYLPDATLYVTLEPCFMCSGALYWSKIGRVVYGAEDDKNGYRKIVHAGASPFHPKTTVHSGVLKDDCAQLMKDFFKGKR
ncbi:MAG TPA: nucleoside deaminase [Ferruginibacter sp.]|nr:nucleoside deaminase [Ferruginibacter sp.]HMP19852.1 nucleoside deaminase [Ferruginibacter sp.]